MPRFNIKQVDQIDYEKELVEFWSSYLPGTPSDRFKWMNSNPEGPPIWFMAFEEKTNQLAGTISVMAIL